MKTRQHESDSALALSTIIVDFEGNVDAPPTLIGWLADGEVTQILVESDLASMVKPGSTAVRTLDEALRELREVAGDRHIGGYSTHDLHIVQTWCQDAELVTWFASAYVNVKRVADRWITRLIRAGQIEPPKDKSLAARMSLVGVRYPVGAGTDIVGRGLRRLRDQQALGKTYATLPPGAKRHWSRILIHNRTDLKATRALLIAATTPTPVTRGPNGPSPAIRGMASALKVDPWILDRVLGSEWKLSSGWNLGTGMAFGPSLVETAGSPRLSIRVEAWGTHLENPHLIVHVSLAPSSGEWTLPTRSSLGGPRRERVTMDDSWVTNLQLALANMREYPIDPRERSVSDIEVIDFWNSCKARGVKPSARLFAKTNDVKVGEAFDACHRAWKAGLIDGPEPRFI